MQDTTTGHFQYVTYKNYTIEIKADPANANGMLIGNYGNSQNLLTGLPLEVPCQIIGDSIFVSFQVIEGDNIPGLSFDDFTIHAQTGYLTTDSIFLEVSYLKNGGDPYYGHAWGKKN